MRTTAHTAHAGCTEPSTSLLAVHAQYAWCLFLHKIGCHYQHFVVALNLLSCYFLHCLRRTPREATVNEATVNENLDYMDIHPCNLYHMHMVSTTPPLHNAPRNDTKDDTQ